MEQIIVFLCTIVSLSSAITLGDDQFSPFVLEGTVNASIEGLRKDIPEPILITDPITINLSDDNLNGFLSVSNIKLSGIKEFQTTYLSFSLIGAKLDSTFVVPSIVLDLDYSIDCQIFKIFDLYGDGQLHIQINQLELDTYFVVQLSGLSLNSISDLKISRLNLDHAIKFSINGLLDDDNFSQLVNGIVENVVVELIATYVEENVETLSDAISPIAEAILNGFLANRNNE